MRILLALTTTIPVLAAAATDASYRTVLFDDASSFNDSSSLWLEENDLHHGGENKTVSIKHNPHKGFHCDTTCNSDLGVPLGASSPVVVDLQTPNGDALKGHCGQACNVDVIRVKGSFPGAHGASTQLRTRFVDNDKALAFCWGFQLRGFDHGDTFSLEYRHCHDENNHSDSTECAADQDENDDDWTEMATWEALGGGDVDPDNNNKNLKKKKNHLLANDQNYQWCSAVPQLPLVDEATMSSKTTNDYNSLIQFRVVNRGGQSHDILYISWTAVVAMGDKNNDNHGDDDDASGTVQVAAAPKLRSSNAPLAVVTSEKGVKPEHTAASLDQHRRLP